MNLEILRDYCLHKKGVTEDLPFDENTLAFRVAGKIFLLCNIEHFQTINLKCDPVKAEELRTEYPEHVFPGYHMNKKHWNTVKIKGISNELIYSWIDHSYLQVISKLPKKTQAEFLSE